MTTTIAETENIVDFVNDNDINMHVLLSHENPYRTKQEQQGFAHWSCKIICRDKFIVIYFSKGAGIRRWIEPHIGISDTIPIHVPHDKVGKPYDGPFPPFENDVDQRTFNSCSQIEPPFLIEVLDILARDIWLIEQSKTFEGWTQALKVNSDSRSARMAFEIVCQQRLELGALLGDGNLHKLLYEIDRLQPDEIEQPKQAE